MAARRRLPASFAVLATSVALVLVPATAGDASPHQTAAQVKSHIKTLEAQARQAEKAQARQRATVAALRAEQARATADLARQRARVEALRVQLAATADYAYRSGGVGGVAELAQVAGPTALLSGTTLDEYADLQAAQLDAFTQAQRQFQQAQAQLTAKAAAARKTLAQLTASRKRLAGLLSKAHALLATLDPARQAISSYARASRSAQRVALPRVSSKRVAAVLRFAYAQLGKPYQYGAAGPSSYDCSGLTMRAWAQAGVSLPHNAAAQQSMLQPVHGAMQPGDLIFEGSPAYHVGIYVGGGRMLHAPQTGEVVKIVPVPPHSSVGRP